MWQEVCGSAQCDGKVNDIRWLRLPSPPLFLPVKWLVDWAFLLVCVHSTAQIPLAALLSFQRPLNSSCTTWHREAMLLAQNSTQKTNHSCRFSVKTTKSKQRSRAPRKSSHRLHQQVYVQTSTLDTRFIKLKHCVSIYILVSYISWKAQHEHFFTSYLILIQINAVSAVLHIEHIDR